MQLKTQCLCLGQTPNFFHVFLVCRLDIIVLFRLIYLWFEAKVRQTSVSVLKNKTKQKIYDSMNTELQLTV